MKSTAHDIKADVPLVSMPQIHRNMPTRAPRTSSTTTPRNLTGVYLGLEKAQNLYPTPTAIPRQSVPPFMKGKGFWKRVRTPTEERRHQKVEQLRDREERRGFSGKPPKRKLLTPDGAPWKENQSPPQKLGSPDADVLDLTRQTNRFFTAVNNKGVVRLEYLNPPVYDNTATTFTSDGDQVPLMETVKNEVNRLALDRSDLTGIEECYKKVCKGNIDALKRLLPHRKNIENKPDNAKRYTGFTVKSYRNPAQAEIIAHFPDPRPHTTSTHQSRLPLASPYFFKVYNQPKTAASLLSKAGSAYNEDQSATQTALARNSTPVFVGATNLKGKTYSVSSGLTGGVNTFIGLQDLASPFVSPRREPPPSSPRSPSLLRPAPTDQQPPLTGERSKVEISVPQAPASESSQQVALPDLEQAQDSNQSGDRVKESNQSDDLNRQDIDQSKSATKEGDQEEAMMPKEEAANSSGPVILIGVEDESGEQLPVEIDEIDDILQKEKTDKKVDESQSEGQGTIHARKKSITERVNKSRESEKALNEMREKAECRQKELASLLDEHAQIVKEIDYDSDDKGYSDDKENSRVPANST